MKFLNILMILCIALFSFFSVFVMSVKKGDRQANILLGLFFMFWGIDLLNGILILNEFYLDFPKYALLSEGFAFLYGPILFFYTSRIVRSKSLSFWECLCHLLPFLSITAVTMINYHMLRREEKVELLGKIMSMEQLPVIYVIAGIAFFHITTYLLISKRVIAGRERKWKELYSNYDIRWLNSMLNAIFLILIISFLGNIFQLNRSRLYFELILPILIILLTLFILRVFWKSLNKPFIWLKEEVVLKYENNQISIIEKGIIASKILKALEEERIFLNPELTLKDLSLHIGYGRRMVSQVINDVMNKSFFNLINFYRIEEAKSKLKNSKDSKLTILEVMYQVGFNSKSSFNTQFKKQTGLTPTEYVKSI